MASFDIDVPPSTLNKNMFSMLKSGKWTDVTFLVKGKEFHAHRCVLTARSAVFDAMFSGCMKEKEADTIIVDDIEPPAFKSMLQFIYSDAFSSRGDMIAHLLVAADRYALERLRLKCEIFLCKHLSVSNVATTLILAARHNSNQLKVQCLKFMSSPEVFMKVARTPEFERLMKICPSFLMDIHTLKLNGGTSAGINLVHRTVIDLTHTSSDSIVHNNTFDVQQVVHEEGLQLDQRAPAELIEHQVGLMVAPTHKDLEYSDEDLLDV